MRHAHLDLSIVGREFDSIVDQIGDSFEQKVAISGDRGIFGEVGVQLDVTGFSHGTIEFDCFGDDFRKIDGAEFNNPASMFNRRNAQQCRNDGE